MFMIVLHISLYFASDTNMACHEVPVWGANNKASVTAADL